MGVKSVDVTVTRQRARAARVQPDTPRTRVPSGSAHPDEPSDPGRRLIHAQRRKCRAERARLRRERGRHGIIARPARERAHSPAACTGPPRSARRIAGSAVDLRARASRRISRKSCAVERATTMLSARRQVEPVRRIRGRVREEAARIIERPRDHVPAGRMRAGAQFWPYREGTPEPVATRGRI